MRELRSLGSVRGVLGNRYSYRDPVTGTEPASGLGYFSDRPLKRSVPDQVQLCKK